jgi:hypothetical protein
MKMNEVKAMIEDVVLTESEVEWLKVFGITEDYQIDNYKLMKKAQELGVKFQLPIRRQATRSDFSDWLRLKRK